MAADYVIEREPVPANQRATYIANRTRDVRSLAAVYAEALDVDALTQLIAAVRELEADITELRTDVRRTLTANRLKGESQS